MNPKITDEMREALQDHPDRPLIVEDDRSNEQYVLISHVGIQHLLSEELLRKIDAGLEQAKRGEVINIENQQDHQAFFERLKSDHTPEMPNPSKAT